MMIGLGQAGGGADPAVVAARARLEFERRQEIEAVRRNFLTRMAALREEFRDVVRGIIAKYRVRLGD
jgi:metal-dependent amidase/aminoacylase/carboxypeptidase family protein